MLSATASCRLVTLVTCVTFYLSGNLAAAFAQNTEALKAYNAGIDAYSKGNTTVALQMFEQATLLDPTYSDAFYNLGSMYYQTKQFDRSRYCFARAVNLNPADTQAKYNLALSLEKLGSYADAVTVLQQIPATDRKYPQAQKKIVTLGSAIQKQAVQAQGPLKELGSNSYSRAGAKSATVNSAPAKATVKPVLTKPQPVAVADPVIAPGVDLRKRQEGKLPVEVFAKGFTGPTGLTLDAMGDLFVANYSKNIIYKVEPSGRKSVFVEKNGLNGPIGLALDPLTGDLFVANYLGGTISRVSQQGRVSVMADGLKKPYYLVLEPNSRTLFITEQENNTVCLIHLAP